uniref:Uncharacterized protein n=1 Tax=Picea glauca TaxID=3330 RepID=A0A101M4A4_PICGL|nr:hypothetical protein ABT39_MTgene478 [Picea glauca]
MKSITGQKSSKFHLRLVGCNLPERSRCQTISFGLDLEQRTLAVLPSRPYLKCIPGFVIGLVITISATSA